MEQEKQTPELLPEVKAKFELKGYQPGPMILKGFGEVDFTKIGLQKAELISAKYPNLLVKIENKAPAAKPATSGTGS